MHAKDKAAPDKAHEEVAPEQIAAAWRSIAAGLRAEDGDPYQTLCNDTADLIEHMADELSTAHASGREEGERAMREAAAKRVQTSGSIDSGYLSSAIRALPPKGEEQ
jgi:hypothetical protein